MWKKCIILKDCIYISLVGRQLRDIFAADPSWKNQAARYEHYSQYDMTKDLVKPPVGYVDKKSGMRFTGGNPGMQENWEKK